jgi:hypothetical protein
MSSKLLATITTGLVLGLSTPGFAQALTLNGTEVPRDQVARLQAHCDALQAAERGSAADSSTEADTAATGGAMGSEGATATDAAGAGATADGGSGAANTSSEAGAAATTGAATTEAAAPEEIDFATLDLATVDLEACRQGGFLGAAAGGGNEANSGAASTSN